MRISCIGGSAFNGFSGSKIIIKAIDGKVIDSFVVPSRSGLAFCNRDKAGEYGKRYYKAMADCMDYNRKISN